MASLSKSAFFSAIIVAPWSGKIIVFVLFILSIVALAIFIKKVKDFRKINSLNKTFLSAFRNAQSLDEFYKIYKIGGKFEGPMARLFEQGYNSKSYNLSALINELVLKEKQNFESSLVFLATTVTISPFLGLLGTVWGILITFMDIRNYGSAHINIVAPGIAESLITTIVGLCVAVPALIFYNYSTNRANNLSDEIEIFSKEIIDRLGKSKIEQTPLINA